MKSAHAVVHVDTIERKPFGQGDALGLIEGLAVGALAASLQDPASLSSVTAARRALDGAEGALEQLQTTLDGARADPAWRELAFDRQVLAPLPPGIIFLGRPHAVT